MRRTVVRAAWLATLLLGATPAAARAEWLFTPFLGYTFKSSTTLVDLETGTQTTHLNFGGSAAVLGEGPIGIEAIYTHTPGYFERDASDLEAINLPASITSSRTLSLMGNVVLTTPRSWNRYGLRPYLSGGIGLMHVQARDQLNNFPIRFNLLGMNLGGGGLGMLTDRIGLRFDLRYLRNIQGPAPEELEVAVTLGQPVRVRYWTTSFGVVIKY